jgi:hypothetical protein
MRRECLDHVVVLGERHLRHIQLSYMQYHNEVRTDLALNKDAPAPRPIQSDGYILCRPILGGLHHQYVRICFTTGTPVTLPFVPRHSLLGRGGRVHVILHGHALRLQRARSMCQGIGKG